MPLEENCSSGFFLFMPDAADVRGRPMQVSARNKAMDLLARREHSEAELRRKLQARGYEAPAVEQAVDSLLRDGLLSDLRFAESYVHQRFNAGMGPLRIGYELRQKGVADELAEQCLETFGERWDELLEGLRRRKYGEAIPEDYAARMKQARFLQNRGFSPESVMRLFGRSA